MLVTSLAPLTHSAGSVVLLVSAATLAGVMNAVAGGGSFVTVPALMLTGVPPTIANATSTAALMPGSFTSAWTLRDELRPILGVPTSALLGASLAGSLVGAVLLLTTPERSFRALLPWLMLVGTVAFALGPRISASLRRGAAPAGARSHRTAVLASQLVLGLYAGYFGGAVGIMMMAAWSLFAADDLRAVNAVKTLIVGAANALATICFAIGHAIWWGIAAMMLVGAVVGGYAGALLVRRVSRERLRIGIVVLSAAITAAMFAYA